MTLASELPGWAYELLQQARVARLALMDDRDRPRVLPVTFAIAEGAIWSAIDEKPKRRTPPARVRWLRRRPDAALCVDVYDDDWSRLRWVQVLGRITVLATADAPVAMAALAAKYAPYARTDPPGPLLRLTPERTLCWRADTP